MTHQGGKSCPWDGFVRILRCSLEALERGERPFMATTMASGPLDELVALHSELAAGADPGWRSWPFVDCASRCGANSCRFPTMVFMEDCYAVISLETLLTAVGAGVRQGLLPAVRAAVPVAQPP
jgi:hypothetical protein